MNELKLKKRTKDNNLKKVLVWGHDGSGKSTFAETYCKKNNLKPICIDVDDTNFTDVPIVEVNQDSSITIKNDIVKLCNTLKENAEYDTIIIDGVSSLLELLVSNANGLKKYSDRNEAFNLILRKLQGTGKNLIFIGQADMRVIYTDEHQSNKCIIKINSIVNEKYQCYTEGDLFKSKVEKMRGVKKPTQSTPVGRNTLKGRA